MFYLDKNRCTGCGACANACATGAIQLVENSEGFLEPVVDEERCISCGACESTCPVLHDLSNNDDETGHCLLVTTKLEQYYKKSATIGLCTMLAEKAIEENGVVFGVWLDESEWKAKHICISSHAELDKIRNSKYIQSDAASCHEDVKSRLIAGRTVLFIGTPCQVAGLNAFLGKQYKNLYTIDLICHGVYSYKLLREEVGYWENKLKGKVENFRFRSKEVSPWSEGGIINFDLRDRNGRLTHVERHGKYSPTYRCYAYSGDGSNYNLRESCYNCVFRNRRRYGDLTVGDAWLISQNYLDWNQTNCSNGVSLAIVNSEKGTDMMGKVSGLVQVKEIPYEAAFVQPALLPSSRTIPAERKNLYDNLGKEEYGSLVNRVMKVDIEKIYLLDRRLRKKKELKKKIKGMIYGKRDRL